MPFVRRCVPQSVRMAPYLNAVRARSAEVVCDNGVQLVDKERALREDAERYRIQMSLLAREYMKTQKSENVFAAAERIAFAAHVAAPAVAGVSMLVNDGSLTGLSVASLCVAASSVPALAWCVQKIDGRQQKLQRYLQLFRRCEQKSRVVDEKLKAIDDELLRRAYVEHEQERDRL